MIMEKRKMTDGYAALYIAIVCNVPTQEAFLMLKGKKTVNRHWTVEEMKDIEVYRENGASWAEIAYIFGANKDSIAKRFNDYKYKRGRWGR